LLASLVPSIAGARSRGFSGLGSERGGVDAAHSAKLAGLAAETAEPEAAVTVELTWRIRREAKVKHGRWARRGSRVVLRSTLFGPPLLTLQLKYLRLSPTMR
jgi:hypothetical protein